jgi:hypothetical protein
MNRWVSSGLSDGYEETNRDGLARSPSALDEPTHRRCIASEQLCQRISNGYVTWRAPDEPTPIVYFSRVKNEKEKKKKGHHRMN